MLVFCVDDAGTDIYISSDTAHANAKRFGVTYKEEMLRCVIHGLLHMQGYRDNTKAAKKKMFNRQESILKKFVKTG